MALAGLECDHPAMAALAADCAQCSAEHGVELDLAGTMDVTEALYYGVPLITFPQMSEQVANADRVQELGLGERLDAATATTETLRAAVTRVTSNPGVYANLDRMRKAIRDRGGATRGVDVIEEYLR